MNEVIISDQSAFRAHLIWMSGSQHNPTVRMLLVATVGIRAVYEGLESWSSCRDWIGQLLQPNDSKRELRIAKKALVRDRFATFRELRIPLYDLASHGFRRVDM
jgi:hypothetical protein